MFNIIFSLSSTPLLEYISMKYIHTLSLVGFIIYFTVTILLYILLRLRIENSYTFVVVVTF
jgi:hypothetical protein